jgi:AcrR family transcriptional regulator
MDTQISHPKNTFSNLPAEKRQRIITAAVREFAAYGYQQASLNRIVKELGIAKGSLYQYFKNKEGLFLYVFQCFITLVKQSVRKEVLAAKESTFFEQVKAILWTGIKFINNHPDYFHIYLRVLFESEVSHREMLIGQVRLFSAEYFGPLCIAAQQNGQIRKDIAPQMVVFVLDALLDRFLLGYAKPYLDGGLDLASKSEEELQYEVNMVIRILQDGLSPRA